MRLAKSSSIVRPVLLALALAACAPTTEPQAEPAQARGDQTGASLFAAEHAEQWRLPGRLREISGLAVSADGRLFAHDDERATIYEIDIASGAVKKAFHVGDHLRGDFEDIAITPQGDFYIVSSTGELYGFREGDDDAHVAFETYSTGLRGRCEIEGLAYLPTDQSLIIACKNNYGREMRNTVALYAWSIRTHTLQNTPWLTLPAARLGVIAGADEFHTSAVQVDSRTNRLVLLAAREHAMAEIDRAGHVFATRRLSDEHVQAEGAAILPDGSLVISDEGGDGQALITRYPRQP